MKKNRYDNAFLCGWKRSFHICYCHCGCCYCNTAVNLELLEKLHRFFSYLNMQLSEVYWKMPSCILNFPGSGTSQAYQQSRPHIVLPLWEVFSSCSPRKVCWQERYPQHLLRWWWSHRFQNLKQQNKIISFREYMCNMFIDKFQQTSEKLRKKNNVLVSVDFYSKP